MVTELNYHPVDASPSEIAAGFVSSDFEWIELQNISDTLTLDLTEIRFTKGIDFDFGPSAVTALGPGQFVLLVRNEAAFALRYGGGYPVAGAFGPDNLSIGGENVKLSFGAGSAIHEFHYLDVAPWPATPDGLGPTLVLLDPDAAPDHALPENWTTSQNAGGSPGADDGGVTLASWKTDHFTPAELADPLVSGDLADVDGDGLSTAHPLPRSSSDSGSRCIDREIPFKARETLESSSASDPGASIRCGAATSSNRPPCRTNEIFDCTQNNGRDPVPTRECASTPKSYPQ